MKFLFVIHLFLAVFWGNLYAQSSQQPVERGKVIVKLAPSAIPVIETRWRTLSQTSSDTTILSTGIQSFDLVSRRFRSTRMRRVFPDAGEYEAKHRQYGLHLWYEITIPESENPETVANIYAMDENVQISEPRYRIRKHVSLLPADEMPNDPNFNKQWNFNNTGQTGGKPGADIRLIDAWEKAKTLGIKNNNVIVAVMDDGVYHDHEDIRANMWVNEAELNGKSGIDDDRNGYVDDIFGYNFVDRTGTISFDNHGTHVAGVIAAVTGNGVGVSGIAGNPNDGYGVKIMTVQILEGDDGVSNIGPAFAYAADNGAIISQNSWGYDKAGVYNQSDITAINYFINEAGKDKDGNPRPGTPMTGGIVIFAAGNDGKDDKWYPAYFNNVLAVAATNHYGKLAWYSNFGSWIDISAPGGDTNEAGKNRTGGIYSTSYRDTNKNYYEYLQGTSMACPHVSGVAALILSVYGCENFTPAMLRSRLLNSATSLNEFDPANASKMGAGLVNASTAIAPCETMNTITDLEIQPLNAVSCRLSWTVPNHETDIYTVACAKTEITQDNFDRYIWEKADILQTSGDTKQIVVYGLDPATTYYIAIRNHLSCQPSSISNMVTATTRINHAPVLARPLPDITLRDVAKETAYYIGDIFTDEDGDDMKYEISVASSRIATAKINGDSLMIKPIIAGATRLTLTADDENTGRTPYSLRLTVTQNQAPQINGLITNITMLPASAPITINLVEYASDPEDDPIHFNAHLSKTGIVNATVEDGILSIKPLVHGEVDLQVTASDLYSATVTKTIHITVEQKYAPDKNNELLLYPNPANDQLWYSYTLTESAPVNIRVWNSAGEIILQTPSEKPSPETDYRHINLNGWSAGVYFVELMMREKVLDVKKFVKQ